MNCTTGSRSTQMSALITAVEEVREEIEEFVMAHSALLLLLLMEQKQTSSMMALSQPLLRRALNNCQDEATRQWLKDKSGSFFQLAEMCNFFEEKIDQEAKKDHRDTVDIIFVAHGSIRLPMIPARRLLPLSNITDVLLYSPWNCATDAKVTYGIATGKMKPQHRVFYCSRKPRCPAADNKHQPTELPNQWNSLRTAGGRMIPTITVSPLQATGGVWATYQSLVERYGPPGRGRIVIPFILPGTRTLGSSDSVPFPAVTLALSLVLLRSRFKATVHLDVCLSKTPAETNLDQDDLKQQYCCAMDDTVMSASDDMFRETWADYFKRFFNS